MTFDEMKKRLQTVLVTLDKLSRSGAMEIHGLQAIQEMAGCSAILNELSELNGLKAADEPASKKAFK